MQFRENDQLISFHPILKVDASFSNTAMRFYILGRTEKAIPVVVSHQNLRRGPDIHLRVDV